jgi:hypothetical protein
VTYPQVSRYNRQTSKYSSNSGPEKADIRLTSRDGSEMSSELKNTSPVVVGQRWLATAICGRLADFLRTAGLMLSQASALKPDDGQLTPQVRRGPAPPPALRILALPGIPQHAAPERSVLSQQWRPVGRAGKLAIL